MSQRSCIFEDTNRGIGMAYLHVSTIKVTQLQAKVVWLFVCLGFIVPLDNFSLIWRRHHYGNGLQMLTFAQHSWLLSSEGSLAW